MPRIGRALMSVSDKRGLVEFAKVLAKHGVQILSTGGTAKLLSAAFDRAPILCRVRRFVTNCILAAINNIN